MTKHTPTSNWDEIPVGFYMLHIVRKQGGTIYTLNVKNDPTKPWYDQMEVPLSSDQGFEWFKPFWGWATENLPAFVWNPKM